METKVGYLATDFLFQHISLLQVIRCDNDVVETATTESLNTENDKPSLGETAKYNGTTKRSKIKMQIISVWFAGTNPVQAVYGRKLSVK